jgi:hypothetical protein
MILSATNRRGAFKGNARVVDRLMPPPAARQTSETVHIFAQHEGVM